MTQWPSAIVRACVGARGGHYLGSTPWYLDSRALQLYTEVPAPREARLLWDMIIPTWSLYDAECVDVNCRCCCNWDLLQLVAL